ncbi:MAG: sensor histidine kinase [Opitutus sp.]|nr:sensor histidine kinase [Opitutus sp.]
MTIKLRFALLLSLLLGAFLLAVLGLRRFERAELNERLGTERQARVQLLSHWIDLTSRALPQFVADTAQSDELAAVLTGNATEHARKKLPASLQAAGMSALWILRADGTVLLQASAGERREIPAPLAPADFVTLVAETPSPRFFADSEGEPIEVCIRRIQPVRTDGAAWLAVARRWDRSQLNALEGLTGARGSLRPAHVNVQAAGGGATVELLRPLPDWQGHPLCVLHVAGEALELESSFRADRRQLLAFVAFGLLFTGAMAVALHRWVFRPLGLISASLASDNPHSVADFAAGKSELGGVVQLVTASAGQRGELQREIARRTRAEEELERSEAAVRRNRDERDRLGRDLHDGVIQSLYAAGMGLSGIRAQLTPGQVDAAVQLEQTRSALNETIHDVRNFIIGLEPESLKLQTFAQAVGAMLATMQSLRPFQSTVEIDEALAVRLTLSQRVHALQITREAVSNALRHGQAGSIHVALRKPGDFVEFGVVDDGAGFDAGTGVSQGKGLANFAQRARELGAELKVDSAPGRGTRVNLIFPLLIIWPSLPIPPFASCSWTTANSCGAASGPCSPPRPKRGCASSAKRVTWRMPSPNACGSSQTLSSSTSGCPTAPASKPAVRFSSSCRRRAWWCSRRIRLTTSSTRP